MGAYDLNHAAKLAKGEILADPVAAFKERLKEKVEREGMGYSKQWLDWFKKLIDETPSQTNNEVK